ncbi:MAG: MerR family transcriptional regulator [Bacillota bacterium]
MPRDAGSGYRVYGDPEIRRLYVIRVLRKARFSLMSIHLMIQHYEMGIRDSPVS